MKGFCCFHISRHCPSNIPLFEFRAPGAPSNTRECWSLVREQIFCLEVRLWQAFQYSARTWGEIRRHNVT